MPLKNYSQSIHNARRYRITYTQKYNRIEIFYFKGRLKRKFPHTYYTNSNIF